MMLIDSFRWDVLLDAVEEVVSNLFCLHRDRWILEKSRPGGVIKAALESLDVIITPQLFGYLPWFGSVVCEPVIVWEQKDRMMITVT